MAHRWWFIATVAALTLTTACSGGKSTPAASTTTQSSAKPPSSTSATTASTDTSSSQGAPAAPLDTNQCVDVTGAFADLLTANDKDSARKAATTLEGFGPPSQVKDAIEHFVSTGGAHFDDPDYTKNHNAVDGWVKQVCPT